MVSEGHLINEGSSLLALMQTIGGANELEGPGSVEQNCVMTIEGDEGDEF